MSLRMLNLQPWAEGNSLIQGDVRYLAVRESRNHRSPVLSLEGPFFLLFTQTFPAESGVWQSPYSAVVLGMIS